MFVDCGDQNLFHLQNLFVNRGDKKSHCATRGCGFFFPICRQLGCGGGRAMEEKEREKRVVKEKEIDLYLFFFSLEIGMECNK